jgi:hypothetical protein
MPTPSDETIPTFEPDLPSEQLIDCFVGINETCSETDSGTEIYACSGNSVSDSAFLNALLEIEHEFIDISVMEGDAQVSLLSKGSIAEGSVSLVEFTSICANFLQVAWRKKVSLSHPQTSALSLLKRSTSGTTGSINFYIEPSSIIMVVLQIVDGIPDSIAVFNQNGIATVESLPDYLLADLNISIAFISADAMDFFAAQDIGTTTIKPIETVLSQEILSSDPPVSSSMVLYVSVAAAIAVILAIIAVFVILRWRRKSVEDDEKPETVGQNEDEAVIRFSKKFWATRKTAPKSKLKLIIKLDSGGFGEV